MASRLCSPIRQSVSQSGDIKFSIRKLESIVHKFYCNVLTFACDIHHVIL